MNKSEHQLRSFAHVVGCLREQTERIKAMNGDLSPTMDILIAIAEKLPDAGSVEGNSSTGKNY